MTIGFVILAHQHLGRVEMLTRWLVDQGAPVAIHIDARCPSQEYSKLKRAFSKDDVVFIDRRKCNWGSFEIVTATEIACDAILRKFQKIDHVMLLSGACLPTGPLSRLVTYLSKNPTVDLIESAPLSDGRWVTTGLNRERFEHYFLLGSFGFRGGHLLLSRWQAKLGIRRKLPDGLTPHLGSQWWCLSRATLTQILKTPRRNEFQRFFKKTLIPDESYFQTLSRLFSSNLVSKSPTLAVFNAKGQPFILYDDHLDMIRRSDRFFARKVWPGADALYQGLLNRDRISDAKDDALEQHLQAIARGDFHRDDVVNAGRAPRSKNETR